MQILIPWKNLAFLPKSYVLQTKLFGTCCMHHLPIFLDRMRPSVFYTLQKEIKFRSDEISISMCSGIRGELIQVQSRFCKIYWNWHLWNIWGVLTPEYFNQALGRKNVFSLRFADGTWFSNQLAGLGYEHKHLCDHFNTDLISVALIPGLHKGCEAGEDDGPLAGFNSFKIGFDVALFAVAGPSPSIFPPLLW